MMMPKWLRVVVGILAGIAAAVVIVLLGKKGEEIADRLLRRIRGIGASVGTVPAGDVWREGVEAGTIVVYPANGSSAVTVVLPDDVAVADIDAAAIMGKGVAVVEVKHGATDRRNVDPIVDSAGAEFRRRVDGRGN